MQEYQYSRGNFDFRYQTLIIVLLNIESPVFRRVSYVISCY